MSLKDDPLLQLGSPATKKNLASSIFPRELKQTCLSFKEFQRLYLNQDTSHFSKMRLLRSYPPLRRRLYSKRHKTTLNFSFSFSTKFHIHLFLRIWLSLPYQKHHERWVRSLNNSRFTIYDPPSRLDSFQPLFLNQ